MSLWRKKKKKEDEQERHIDTIIMLKNPVIDTSSKVKRLQINFVIKISVIDANSCKMENDNIMTSVR